MMIKPEPCPESRIALLHEIEHERAMLMGIINRIICTDDSKELMRMEYYAHKRIERLSELKCRTIPLTREVK